MDGIAITDAELTELILTGKLEFAVRNMSDINMKKVQDPIYNDHLPDRFRTEWCSAQNYKNNENQCTPHCNRPEGHSGLHERTYVATEKVMGKAAARWK